MVILKPENIFVKFIIKYSNNVSQLNKKVEIIGINDKKKIKHAISTSKNIIG